MIPFEADLVRLVAIEASVASLAARVIASLAAFVGAHQATLSIVERDRGSASLRVIAGWGAQPSSKRVAMGEGLIGQCARDRRTIVARDVPDAFFTVRSSLGAGPPRELVVAPLSFEGELAGVVELASLGSIDVGAVERACPSIAAALHALDRRLAAEEHARAREADKRALEDRCATFGDALTQRSELLASLSHELRTPLNSILVLAQLLAEGELGAKQRDYVDTIAAAGGDLLALVSQLLDLARMETGKVRPAPHPIETASFVAFVQEAFADEARLKGLELEVDVAPDAPRLFLSDEARLRQAIDALLATVIKASREERVVLRASAARVGDEEAIALAVSGFDGVSHQGSLGLALALCGDIAELLGGSLDVKDGAATVVLPLGAVGARRVLVVDEDARARFDLSRALERSEIEVVPARDSNEALDVLEGERVDAVLLDVTAQDGCDAARVIRAIPRYARLPIVAVSGQATPGLRERCLRAGCDDFVTRPLADDRLLTVVHHAMTRGSGA